MRITSLLETSDELLTQLDSLTDRNGDIQVTDVFPLPLRFENYTSEHYPPESAIEHTTVNIYDLHPIQDAVEAKHVRMYLEGRGRSGKDPVFVVVNPDGEHILQDGHHRVVAAMLQGQMMIEADVAYVASIQHDDDFNMVITYHNLE